MNENEIMEQPPKKDKDLWRNIQSLLEKMKGTKVIPEEYRLPDNIIPLKRYQPDMTVGLTSEQVEERISRGAVNAAVEPASKSTKEIICSNVFTYFNLIFFIIAILLILVGSFRDLTFLPVIVSNTLIGIIQELRAKKVLDDLSILNAPKNRVLRDGKEETIPAEELVLDDMIILGAGNQIPADAVVVDGNVLVNESLITGETNQIPKVPGSELLSGSFVISGECHARIEKVGRDSYVSRLTLEAKEMNEEESSEMIRSLDKLVKTIGILIIPIAIILFSQQYFINEASIRDSVTSTAAAIVGMIPEGLYLLASVALVVSVMRLATQKVLVHNMKCIETLARVDVLCVDKTGTITENTMTVKKMLPLMKPHKNEAAPQQAEAADAAREKLADGILETENAASEEKTDGISETVNLCAGEKTDGISKSVNSCAEEKTDSPEAVRSEASETDTVSAEEGLPDTDWIANAAFSHEAAEEMELAMGDFAAAMATDNVTMKAIKDYFRKRSGKRPEQVFPFSSDTKYSGAVFEDANYVLGAPEYILRENYRQYEPQISYWSSQGYRVLVFARYQGDLDGKALTEKAHPMGMILLANPIRENAKETFGYFAGQGVEIKVISGDNPVTVSEVAKEAQIAGAEKYVDASLFTEDKDLFEAAENYTVFGRVSPEQKRKLISALKSKGHTVAMTGDGVNDVLALKDADCSIAMASGSDAAAQVSQLVLLESDFGRMPSVVAEGRRVVNNIERTASLFLVKNIFSLFMSIFSIVLLMNYPLEPSQISLISMFTIGIPAFVMSLEKNTERIEGHFLSNVLFKALPGGLTDFIVVSALYLFCMEFSVNETDVSTSATIVLAIVGLMILYKIASPMNKYHWILWGTMAAGLIYCIIFVRNIFAITSISKKSMMLLVIFAIITEPTFRYLSIAVKKISILYNNRHLKGKTK